MDLDTPALVGLCLLVFLVAALYSSVGHGGASGYLATLSFFGIAPAQMATTALVLNTLTATTSFTAYVRAGYLSLALTWPFLVASVPAAFVGGLAHLKDRTYFLLLAVILTGAAIRLAMSLPASGDGQRTNPPPRTPALASGAGIGLLSGMVGVGGGIFLSPIMVLMKWADAKQTAATSAIFIVVNSIAGLAGRAVGGALQFGLLAPLLLAAFLGGLVGSHTGANKFTGLTVRRLLAVVLVIAAFKLVITSW